MKKYVYRAVCADEVYAISLRKMELVKIIKSNWKDKVFTIEKKEYELQRKATILHLYKLFSHQENP